MKEKLTGSQIREKFIKFFEEKHGHKHVKSSSLIPNNPTVLLTTAGMLQFVPIFLGQEKPPEPPRAVSVQKCARAGGKDSDIENVGRTPRHHTFFEMLGNFSFGDYFKEEIIPWSWDFITNILELDKNRLWITVFETDDEAAKIWEEKAGVAKTRILRKGKKDNFWGPPGASGPCGPCSEIHYDLGKEYACDCPQGCSIDTCECDRWVEIWNLVFMELNQDEEGNQTPLENKNVDTGMGLERITMVVNGVNSTFETDLLKPILDKVCEMTGKKYKENDKTDISLRIITDHIRCVSFMIADGLKPGNEGRNYVLRMILRRALRHGKILGLELPFLYKLVNTIIENYSNAYPELKENQEKITSVIKKEEERFNKTISYGLFILEEIIRQLPSATSKPESYQIDKRAVGINSSANLNEPRINQEIPGEEAFKLYDTYGFPLELTIEIAKEKGIEVDIDGFEKQMKAQKERAKAAHKQVGLASDTLYLELSNKFGATEFIGYKSTSSNSQIKAVISDGEITEEAFKGDEVEIILDKTPFYAESGGQVGDTGIIKSDNFEAKVADTKKINDMFIHKATISSGKIQAGKEVQAIVDKNLREDITIHHTSAHLLQSALRCTLGDEIAQAGSYVEKDRTRFDFSFDRALTKGEIEQIENLMNKWISQDLKQSTEVMSIEEAKKAGALALFSEKYDDKVRVVSVGGISKELCGGTHVKSTSQIRLVKIISESAIAAGVRRIEAVCADSAIEYYKNKENQLETLAQNLKAPVAEVVNKTNKLINENKEQQKQIKELEKEIAKLKVSTIIDKAIDIEGGKALIERVDGMQMPVLKTTAENISDKIGNSIIVLISKTDEKVAIIVKVSDNFIDKGINAGKLVNEIASICDGKGGGRPNFAQAGAKNPLKIDEAIKYAKKLLL